MNSTNRRRAMLLTKVGKSDREGTFPEYTAMAELRRFPSFATWRAIGEAQPHFGHSPFADLRLSVPLTEYGIE